jgi:F-type H+-transporting ATPase subunit b
MALEAAVPEASNFLVPNGTFIVEVIVFLIILLLLGRYVLPYVQKAMRQRQEVIRQQIEDAEAARAKLAEAQAEYQKALNEARTKAAQIRDVARAEAQRTIDELTEQAQQESARIVARGEEQLAHQREATVRELRSEIGTLAVELAGRIVGDSLADESRRQATVERFLSELDSEPAATAAGDGAGASG